MHYCTKILETVYEEKEMLFFLACDVRATRTKSTVQMLPILEYVHIFITVLNCIYEPNFTALGKDGTS